jgi:hypothetical protein
VSGVDVLAVLDDLVADMGDTPGTTGHQVEQARAAVAELIEAAGAAHHHLKELRRRVSATNLDDADYLTEVESDTSALRAALARCRGGES